MYSVRASWGLAHILQFAIVELEDANLSDNQPDSSATKWATYMRDTVIPAMEDVCQLLRASWISPQNERMGKLLPFSAGRSDRYGDGQPQSSVPERSPAGRVESQAEPRPTCRDPVADHAR